MEQIEKREQQSRNVQDRVKAEQQKYHSQEQDGWREQSTQQEILYDIAIGEQGIQYGALLCLVLGPVCLLVGGIVETQAQLFHQRKGFCMGEIAFAIAQDCPANAQCPHGGYA